MHNSFVNSCKTDIIISTIMQAVPTHITMLKNHRNNGLAILHGSFLPRRYTDLINPFSSDAYQYVMQVIIVQELMNLLHGNKFSP